MIFFVIIIILAVSGLSASTNIECSFGFGSYPVVGDIYRCSVNNNPNILTEESAEISRISGTHERSKSNRNVLGFRAVNTLIQVFPKGLEKFFKHLKVIHIESCQLKEIHQSDLKDFPDLFYFSLIFNGIEVIEEDPNVFDHLSQLKYFWINVPCVHQQIDNSRQKVLEAIKTVKSNCSDSEIFYLKTQLESQLKRLEIESKTLNSTNLSSKLQEFEKKFENSKTFIKNQLKKRFEKVKLNICSNCRQMAKLESMDTRIASFEDIKDQIEDQASFFNDFFNILNKLKINRNEFQELYNKTIEQLEAKGQHKSQAVSINELESKVSQIKITSMQLSYSLNNAINSIGGIKVNLISVNANLKTTQESIMLMHNDTKEAITKISALQNDTIKSLDNLKSSQESIKSSLNSFKNDCRLAQDELKVSMTKLSEILKNHKQESKTNQIEIKSMLNSIKKDSIVADVASVAGATADIVGNVAKVTASGVGILGTVIGAAGGLLGGLIGGLFGGVLGSGSSSTSQNDVKSLKNDQKVNFNLLSEIKTGLLNQSNQKVNNVSNIFQIDVQMSFKSFESEEMKQLDQIKQSQKASVDSIDKLNSKANQIQSTINHAILGLKLTQESVKSSFDSHRDDYKVAQAKLAGLVNQIGENVNKHDDAFKIFQNQVQVTFKTLQSEQRKHSDQLKLFQDLIKSSFRDNFDVSQKLVLSSLNKIAEKLNEHIQESKLKKNDIICTFELLQNRTKLSSNNFSNFYVTLTKITETLYDQSVPILILLLALTLFLLIIVISLIIFTKKSIQKRIKMLKISTASSIGKLSSKVFYDQAPASGTGVRHRLINAIATSKSSDGQIYSQEMVDLTSNKITKSTNSEQQKTKLNNDEDTLNLIQNQMKLIQDMTDVSNEKLNSKVDELLFFNANQNSPLNEIISEVGEVRENQKQFEDSLKSIKYSQDSLQSSLSDLKTNFDEYKNFTESSIRSILEVLKEIQESVRK
ncbi:unnamed protein product [Chironomus riparius]|uniref:Uncharacterized protein n=1 Tax=Chironomus riparius TaxID=315576 RepID=A0A9N9WY63_9DIPT|nr:unnamed protein product [Chironomus riparius]